MGLKEFASTNTRRGGRPCCTCVLSDDIRREVEQGYQEGIAITVISRYLKHEGYAVSENSARNHLKGHQFL